MKYFAAKGVAVLPAYSSPATFPTQGWFPAPLNKLAVFVDSTDVVAQLLTEVPGGWQADQNEEILFRAGWSGRDPLPQFYAVRFRVWEGTTFGPGGRIDVEAYSINA